MTSPTHDRRVYICFNGNCASRDLAQSVYDRLVQLTEEHHLNDFESPTSLKCKLAGCLNICANGPTLIVLPDRVWYHHVDLAAAERIFYEHLLANQPVTEYVHPLTHTSRPPGGSA